MAQKKKEFPYLERDISWMYFNERILQEATREHVPLLERMSFLGIYSNNLDEFFRVRMASQSRIAECTDRSAARESEHAKKVIKQINKLNAQYAKAYSKAVDEVTEALRRENIFLVSDTELTPEQQDFIHDYYHSKLSGLIVPVWFSAIKMLDYENDEDIYLAVKVTRHEPRTVSDYAFLELPVAQCGRFVRLPDHEGKSYLMYLDDAVRHCLPFIFEGLGYTGYEAYTFKFTRDAEMEIDNDLRTGMLQKISKGVKSRKRGEPLRVLYDARMPKDLLKRVLRKLDLDSLDTVLAGGRYQNHKDFMKFPDCGRGDLRYPAWPPILKRELDGPESLIRRIQEKDRFLHVPYHSFDSFIRLLQEAAVSKEVDSIKMTLYRLAKESKVVKALIGAARNGKKVTVVIELLARFDEASNINWSKRMQEAGIKVIFGVEGLKVHSKLVHIGMKRGTDVACISTGNFHEGNARTYTDCMLMTASRRLVKDVDSVFSFIERPYSPIRFKELLVSPNEMKNKFVTLINNEIKNKKSGKPAYIKIKINHITDPVMVEKLYEASRAGVDIDLLVRGNCSLVTGIPDVSDHIRIHGIIDRYLEHSRIFVFAAGGEERVFIGSADWMTRNLDHRVEVVTPIYDPAIKEEMKRIVDYGFRDTLQARIVDGEGKNLFCEAPEGEPPFRSQEALYEYYREAEQSNEEKGNDDD
ncbi:RNA degradosome polyphosphate kinase [Phocaeicola coprophilus]|nr:RNA degradosome polyphosphate kinase [Phocaeicola coprophilus]